MSKKLIILGAGESGTGAALLAQAKGFTVFVSDIGRIKEHYRFELSSNNIECEEGKHTLDRILSADLVIKSPGIPNSAKIVLDIIAKGIEIVDEIEFAFRFLEGKVIAITGTNGKTTTALLTYHLMKAAGFKVALGGNVGESLARKVISNEYDWFVVEVSSYQLDGTTLFKPDIAMLLNITPDHLDRYDYQLQNYINSKFQLAQHLTEGNHFIFYKNDPIISEELKNREIKAALLSIALENKEGSAYSIGTLMHFVESNEQFQIKQEDTSLKGPHNLINTMAAVVAARLAGVKIEFIREGLKTFVNAPHRLESVACIEGVEFINDSKATNVDSVIYALDSFDCPLIWIAGGVDKGNNYDLLKDQVARKVKTLICLGKENEKLKEYFKPLVSAVLETQHVKELVCMALKAAGEGDVVLLSPACASFDLFKDYIDRGDQFREAVLELKEENENSLAI